MSPRAIATAVPPPRCSSSNGSAQPAPAQRPPDMAAWLASRQHRRRWWQRLIGRAG